MTRAERQSATIEREPAALGPAVWSVVAAFGVYFCAYGFRKPFTAAAFADGSVWGMSEKTALVTAQVLGYTASKVIGIRVIAEMPPHRRAGGIVLLVASAEAALILFGAAPRPLHVFCLFLNGLPLGMIFGLVIGFLEGRRNTEALAAGLCASFILADGVTKSLGAWILGQGVPERWMPALAGLVFAPPLLVCVWMLTRIRPPDFRDVAHRSERRPITRAEQRALLLRYAPGLSAIVALYLLITVVRSIRADFAPEIWRGLGTTVVPATFAQSEMLVALGVLLVNGLASLIVDNRRAFFTGLGVSFAGGLLMVAALVGLRQSWIDGFTFMVLIGLGLYLPYVAVHTTIFERLIALTRERGNLGFLMYVADAVGYIGYAALMIGKGLMPVQHDFLGFFTATCGVAAIASGVCVGGCWLYFARRPAAVGEASSAP
jgi:hypothetical protein